LGAANRDGAAYIVSSISAINHLICSFETRFNWIANRCQNVQSGMWTISSSSCAAPTLVSTLVILRVIILTSASVDGIDKKLAVQKLIEFRAHGRSPQACEGLCSLIPVGIDPPHIYIRPGASHQQSAQYRQTPFFVV